MSHASAEVVLSTKSWEADYRSLLRAEALEELFAPFGPGRRQVVLNRITDRAAADALAAALLDAGVLDVVLWAEDAWPRVADRVGVPLTWFGAAWPYSAPELCALDAAGDSLLLHVAGDVRLEHGQPWVARARQALHDGRVALASPTSPDGQELTDCVERTTDGFALGRGFSDQCFLASPATLLDPAVVRATHPVIGSYPRPGGAVTFEARVGAWLHSSGRLRATDATRRYLHPVTGAEGDSYAHAAHVPELLPATPRAGSCYPAPASAPITAVLIVRNQERTVGAAVASVGWCERVVLFDQESTDRTALVAAEAGAEVVPSAVTGTVEPARRAAVAQVGADWVLLLDGDELVPPDLAHRLVQVVRDGSVSGVSFPRRNFIGGSWARGAGWWPDRQTRLFRSRDVRLPAAIHGAIEVDGRVLDLEADTALALTHFNYSGLSDWWARTDRYTSVQANGVVFDRNVSARAAVREFLTRLLRDGGWRLGRQGVRLSLLGALYTWLYVEKSVEAAAGGEVAVRAHYDEIAAHLLTDGSDL